MVWHSDTSRDLTIVLQLHVLGSVSPPGTRAEEFLVLLVADESHHAFDESAVGVESRRYAGLLLRIFSFSVLPFAFLTFITLPEI